ncbi:MAG TPA: hypothetical protein VFR03_14090 [Thermoanaerobaculia bacterium]|nr:hypothetical protein [Thermoanaerobaculia bacterium]
MSTPPFVVPTGVMQIPPNYAYKRVGQRGFPLKASFSVLKDLVDGCLNANLQGTGISYTPIPTLTQYSPVYVMVSTYGSMVSKLPPFSGIGTMGQAEVIFTIPLLRFQGLTCKGLAYYTPYSFVDNSWSIITGNLLMGFQKGLAAFQLPSKVSEPYPTEISTPVFPVFDPSTPLSWKKWIRIERQGDGRRGLEPRHLWPLGSVEDLYGRPDSAFRVEERVLGGLRATMRSGFAESVQLLQLRDPTNPDVAAYSRVVRFAIRLQGVHDGNFLAPAKIDIESFDSLPVAKTLGLAADQGPFLPFVPYWVDCDFDFDLVSGVEDLPDQGWSP